MERNFIIEVMPEESSKSVICVDRDVKEQLLQYNLNESLIIKKFRFTGQMISQSSSEYQEVIESLFGSNVNCHELRCAGEATVPARVEYEPLSVAVMSMSFFDRLYEHGRSLEECIACRFALFRLTRCCFYMLYSGIVGPGGRIKGCFDDTFDGVTVSTNSTVTFRTTANSSY